MQNFSGGVGFFDSGIGGLTVMNACRNLVFDQPFYYLGDNGRAPYGNLPTYLIRAYAYEAMERFVDIGVQAVVLACNTVTAICADEFRKKYPFPILGVEPAVLPATKKGRRIGVLATRATVESPRFQRLLEKAKSVNPQATFIPLPCEGLAKEIEVGIANGLRNYDKWLPPAQLDGVVLGCTHYVFIRKQIEAFYNCPAYDGNEGVANRLQSCLNTGKKVDVQPTFTLKKEEVVQLPSTCNHAPIFFLGASNTLNKRIYEQMFAKFDGKVVKNPKKV